MARRVMVTGGARGIGRETVIAFSKIGAIVSVCDLDLSALKCLQNEVGGLITEVCDISDPPALESAFSRILDKLGGLDVLVNNAGVPGPVVPVESLELCDWHKVIQVNLNATFYVSRLAIPYLKASGNGVIVIMSSVAGRLGYTNRGAYAASKWGLIGLTKTLSRELGPYNIRVNAILPGIVEGARLDAFLEHRASTTGRSMQEEKEQVQSGQSIRQFVSPRDIAELTVFLCSDSAKSISGQMLSIDNDTQNIR